MSFFQNLLTYRPINHYPFTQSQIQLPSSQYFHYLNLVLLGLGSFLTLMMLVTTIYWLVIKKRIDNHRITNHLKDDVYDKNYSNRKLRQIDQVTKEQIKQLIQLHKNIKNNTNEKDLNIIVNPYLVVQEIKKSSLNFTAKQQIQQQKKNEQAKAFESSKQLDRSIEDSFKKPKKIRIIKKKVTSNDQNKKKQQKSNNKKSKQHHETSLKNIGLDMVQSTKTIQSLLTLPSKVQVPVLPKKQKLSQSLQKLYHVSQSNMDIQILQLMFIPIIMIATTFKYFGILVIATFIVTFVIYLSFNVVKVQDKIMRAKGLKYYRYAQWSTFFKFTYVLPLFAMAITFFVSIS